MNVSFFGHLVKNPEFKTTNGGSQMLRFRVRTNLNRKDENGHRKTAFIDVACWGKQGELIANNFVNKSRIYISGDIDDITSNTGNNGQIYTNISMNLQSFEFIDSKEEQAALFAAEGKVAGGQAAGMTQQQMPAGVPGGMQMPGVPNMPTGIPGVPNMPAAPAGVPAGMPSAAPAFTAVAGTPQMPGMPPQAPAVQPPATPAQPTMPAMTQGAPAGVPQMPAMPAGLSSSAFAGM